MRFDDRLATLLTLPVAGPHSRSVRWRQLVELAARMSEARGADSDSAPMVAALAVVRAERDAIPLGVRSAAARAVAGRRLGPELLALFAEDTLAVAAPVLAAADPDAETKAMLVAAAGGDTRQFLRTLWPDTRAADEGESRQAGRRLGDVVEQLKAARDRLAEPPPESPVDKEAEDVGSPRPRHDPAPLRRNPSQEKAPAQHLVDERPAVGSFAFEAASDGAVTWVDGAPRAALIGHSLFADPELAMVVGARQPFDNVEAHIGSMPGRWALTGTPQHDEESGMFLGYRGRAQRADLAVEDAPSASASRPTTGLPQDPTMLRELVHEIKTPLNAIIGFAEIIDGQYLGPAHRRYRERAAEIVAQARILLEAIKDLDFAARLQSRDRQPEALALNALLEALGPDLEGRAQRVGVTLDLHDVDGEGCVTDGALAQRLATRFIHAMIDAGGEGEEIVVRAGEGAVGCHLDITLPKSLADRAPEDLVDPALMIDARGKALLGTGFSLRLVRGLARVGSGDLLFIDGTARLVLPRLT
ncbi:histidine kinase dimerization/phospho-acceptor domain-containing protein [Sphingomicrobium arenosum]|uniref:histidine kinase dimerization/phospho-acceptor domain-containing protein n=1 Tax=Sphingomicrobium arenosum TaxID=2233861 RepID=UPI00223F7F48|nr:histidine kinase dimerization/phospho-acceptor domain-containing protein [Sphingomicrobium arenosum]